MRKNTDCSRDGVPLRFRLCLQTAFPGRAWERETYNYSTSDVGFRSSTQPTITTITPLSLKWEYPLMPRSSLLLQLDYLAICDFSAALLSSRNNSLHPAHYQNFALYFYIEK